MSFPWNLFSRKSSSGRVGDGRTWAQVKEHYEIEKSLANKLRNASRQERQQLYRSVYAEYYQRVHPHRTFSPEHVAKKVSAQLEFLRPFLKRETTFWEIGPGNGALSLEVAKHVHAVYTFDVSDELVRTLTYPPNFHFAVSGDHSVPLPASSVDVAYSNQVFEHLHPEDGLEHLEAVYRTLIPGGTYICSTPNRLSGPWDISASFDEIASGFHLREYTNSEMTDLFIGAGFSEINIYVGNHRVSTKSFSFRILRWCETVVGALHPRLRRTVVRRLMSRLSVNLIRVVATK